MRDRGTVEQPRNINLRLKAYRGTWPRARKIRQREKPGGGAGRAGREAYLSVP